MQWMGSDTQEALGTGDTETVKERSPLWNVTLPNRMGPKSDLKYNAKDNKTRKQSNKPMNAMQCSYHSSGLNQEIQMEKQKASKWMEH